mgnify:CR=1 FL=1
MITGVDAREWDRRYLESELIWGAPPNATVAEYTEDLPHGRALDLACGEGRHALWLAGKDWDVTAVDWSQVAIDKARTVAAKLRRHVRDRVEWIRTDVTEAKFHGGFTLVLSAYLHLPGPQRRRMLDAAIEALEPSGTFLMLGHDTTNIERGVGGPQDPSILFTPDEVAAEIGDRLHIVTAQRVYRQTDDGEAVDALVVATKVPPELDGAR